MLSLAGVGCKQYEELVGRGRSVPEVSCPDPECQAARLPGAGLVPAVPGRGVWSELRRLRCRRCGVGHALLPDGSGAPIAIPPLPRWNRRWRWACRAVVRKRRGEAGSVGVRRVRRWLRSDGSPLATAVQALLAPAAAPWWRRAQQVVGKAAGWLTRLRHWPVVTVAVLSRRRERGCTATDGRGGDRPSPHSIGW